MQIIGERVPRIDGHVLKSSLNKNKSLNTEKMTITESILSNEEEPIWCLEKNEESGHFWRRNSATSRVKFKHDVEILEFVRDPEEDIFVSTHFSHTIGERNTTNPIIVLSTCICAIAVTVLLPWFMIQSNEPVE